MTRGAITDDEIRVVFAIRADGLPSSRLRDRITRRFRLISQGPARRRRSPFAAFGLPIPHGAVAAGVVALMIGLASGIPGPAGSATESATGHPSVSAPVAPALLAAVLIDDEDGHRDADDDDADDEEADEDDADAADAADVEDWIDPSDVDDDDDEPDDGDELDDGADDLGDGEEDDGGDDDADDG